MKNTKEYLVVKPRTCANCGKELTNEELEESANAVKERYLGHHYCSDHLEPALDGEYTIMVGDDE